MANLLTDDVDGQIYDGAAHNANNQQIEDSFTDLGPLIISGLAVSAGIGLSVAVTAGVAFIGGNVTKSAGFTISGLTNGTTNYLYLLQDGTTDKNTTGTPPALSVLLGTCVTAAGAVSSVDTNRSSGRQLKVRTESLVHGGPGAGNPASIDLSAWAASAANGVTVFGVLPAGAVPASSLATLSDVTLTSVAQGDTLYRGASKWNNLAAGTAGQVYITNGPAANPAWSSTVGALTLSGDLTLSTHNLVTDTSTGTKIGTGTTQKLGFFNATPVAQIAGSTDVLAGLVTLGFRAASSNPPFNIGTGALTCGLLTCGAFQPGYKSKSANYTLDTTDTTVFVDASGGAVTIALPTAASIAGRLYSVKKTDSSANAVTINTTSSQTIDGSLTQTLSTQYQSYTVVSDGANWGII